STRAMLPATSDPNPGTSKRPAHRTMFRRGRQAFPEVHPVPQTSYHDWVMNSFVKVRTAGERRPGLLPGNIPRPQARRTFVQDLSRARIDDWRHHTRSIAPPPPTVSLLLRFRALARRGKRHIDVL